jgi:hypothetical protein
LVLALVGIVSLSFGTESLSASSVQREIQGKVVDDPDAYLGIRPVGMEGCGEGTLLLLRNQYPSGVDLSLDVRVVDTTGVAVTEVDAPTTLADDGVGVVSGNVTATGGTPNERTVTVRVVATGSGVRTTLTRTYRVGC